MKIIDTSLLRDGMGTDEAGTSPLDLGIELCISPNDPRKRRSHNGTVRYLDASKTRDYKLTTPPGWYVGNAEEPRSAWQPIKGNGSLEAEMNDDTFPRDVRFIWPHGATVEQGRAAAARFEPGIPYNLAPYARRILQLIGLFDWKAAVLALLIPNVRRWADCTQNWRNCWLPEGIDPYEGNVWANPGDTVTAEDKGLIDVAPDVVKEVL